ncbi:MAG: ABC transporter ATP-binding protein [Spirochaetes bacterium]|nr:MAG: ABC transporter ATP-binding protein [Spirochaetota bacterium]
MNPAIKMENLCFKYPEGKSPLFTDLNISVPPGVVSLIGQNGTGKSTFLLLAGARLYPDRGTVKLLGKDTREIKSEEEKNKYASFIYQNLEFETEEPVEVLLHYVYEKGYHRQKDRRFLERLIDTLELSNVLNKKTQNISKGELQRTIIAFSMLYGSKIIMMDEPMFAMEDYQKEIAMKFLLNYARETGTGIYYSVHELELSKRFSDYLIVFFKDGRIKVGKTKEIFDREVLEEAYQVPYGMLYQKERLYRKHLNEISGKVSTA